MSNTKLSSSQKENLKEDRQNFSDEGAEVFHFPEYRVTVVIMPEFENSKMSRVAIAYASPDEKKFRPKVGEYFAYNHMDDGSYVKVPTPDETSVTAEELARAIGYRASPTWFN